MSVTIRQAQLDDIPHLQALFRQLDTWHHDLFPDVIDAPDREGRPASDIAAFIEAPESDYLVATREEAILGFFSLREAALPDAPLFRPRRFARIDSAVVDERHRGRGIGHRLFESAIDWAAKRGLFSIQATVWNDNTGAQRFYEELGFLPVTQKLEFKIEEADASGPNPETP